jgi:hypothetical protein
MALTTRLTPSGQAKQAADEYAAWKTLTLNAVGTAEHGNLVATATWNVAGNVTAINRTTATYIAFKPAHKNATVRARMDRQREQHALAHIGPHPTAGIPCRVLHTAVIRDTIRLAILPVQTREDYGGGTMLTPGNATKATLPQLMAYLDRTLEKIEASLRDPANHRDEADLRAADHPPLQILLSSEWFFRLPNRPFTQIERTSIETQLIALSRKYPEWLLVPGSIYWSPDAPANPTIRVYNQALVLFAGSLIHTRTKRESHDIDGDLAVRSKERWGPDWPIAVPLAVQPVTVPLATLDAAIFTHKGLDFCVEICRDQWIGDAVAGYFNHAANNTGADVYLFTSNGTTWQDEFAPVRDQGIAVWCDGSGVGSHTYSRMTRVNPINHNMVPFNNFRAAFVVDRSHDVLSGHGFNDAQLIERQNSPAYQSFMARYAPVFNNPTTDALLRNAADLHVAGIPGAGGVVQQYYEKGLRIQFLLVGGVLPTGIPITAAEILVMTPYAASLVLFGAEDIALNVNKAATDALKLLAKASLPAVKVALAPGMIAVPTVANLELYELVDL